MYKNLTTDSEEYAIIWEQQYLNEAHKHRETKKLKAFFDELMKDDDSRLPFFALLDLTESCLKETDEFVDLYQIKAIYESEKEAGEEHTLLDVSSDRAFLNEILLQSKYMLSRIEFLHEDEDILSYVRYIRECGLSIHAVRMFINFFNVDIVTVMYLLAKGFINQGMLNYAFTLLRECDELNSGNEEVLVLMAGLYHVSGHNNLARHCLDVINNPSEYIKDLYDEYS